MKTSTILVLPLLGFLSLPLFADEMENNKQCELIANLTGDYYHHKQSGKSKQDVEQTMRPEFANDEFLRVVDLAINLAYTFPDDLPEEAVEQQVFKGCEQHQH
ncbi:MULTISPECIES: hypothetical protein [unclassified Methylophaga]|jgi:hypothetical protein|uniref:hypothetical protein n=1 Tax=unclassified Methylophaga TaxID=2629249 RepID=UPI000C8D6A59|nr:MULTISPECIES: hypothetical protein [unclassified Methylophaga]MAK65649.1 hypothetical protein [Methylophaga sp.]MAY16372.1 hypothetical protein [Methylophaga sp.]MBN45128.1 hypothetical protein [Methylophaga sp.]HAO23881.1 hypothetical protein [Methylophaga sp.]HCD06002.1 hypothetical protein [Methylophaga sp.]|tara:strand:- start:54500 stop:54808 length:309 start_codon:yes stop_codon:yes gene_type:complete